MSSSLVSRSSTAIEDGRVGVALAVIGAATLYAQHAADRAHPATVLREDV